MDYPDIKKVPLRKGWILWLRFIQAKFGAQQLLCVKDEDRQSSDETLAINAGEDAAQSDVVAVEQAEQLEHDGGVQSDVGAVGQAEGLEHNGGVDAAETEDLNSNDSNAAGGRNDEDTAWDARGQDHVTAAAKACHDMLRPTTPDRVMLQTVRPVPGGACRGDDYSPSSNTKR